MSTYDGGPFPHSDGHGDSGRGDGGQPGGNEQAGRAGEPEYGATRLKASLRASNTRTGERRRTAPHPANTRRSQAPHPTSQAARTASPTPTSAVRPTAARPAARAGRLGGLQSVPADRGDAAAEGEERDPRPVRHHRRRGDRARRRAADLARQDARRRGVALGIYFVVSGVIRIVSAIVTLGLPAGWRILDILIGIMLSVGGVLMLKNAALSGQRSQCSSRWWLASAG